MEELAIKQLWSILPLPTFKVLNKWDCMRPYEISSWQYSNPGPRSATMRTPKPARPRCRRKQTRKHFFQQVLFSPLSQKLDLLKIIFLTLNFRGPDYSKKMFKLDPDWSRRYFFVLNSIGCTCRDLFCSTGLPLDGFDQHFQASVHFPLTTAFD